VRVENMEVWDKTELALFSDQTCTIPPCMKERVYRIFILICKHVELHGESDMDILDKLFCLVPASIKALWLSCSNASG